MKLILLILVILSIIKQSNSLYVQGRHLYDDDGYKVLIRGVARPSLEWNPLGENLNLDDYKKMKEWGCSTVRLTLNQDYWLKNATKHHPFYKRIVHKQVSDIRSLNMTVILDLHWSDDGDLKSYQPGQKKMADENSIQFWKEISKIYKDDSNIIFELYNEPEMLPTSIWMYGGHIDGKRYVGMQELYDAVRENADNVVIVNGIEWGYDLSGLRDNPITGYNIMFGSHPYQNSDNKKKENWERNFGYLSKRYPVISTEFGEFNCNPTYIKDFLEYANKHSIHYTAWAWYPSSNPCSFPSIISNWNGEPTSNGLLIKEDLLKSKEAYLKGKSF